jgi:hypothetical protein
MAAPVKSRGTGHAASRAKSAAKSATKSAAKTGVRAGRRASAKRKSAKRWSARVTRESDSLDLRGGVFKLNDPKRIAASLKRSAEASKRRKSSAYRSALSMLTFYINRAGRNLSASRRHRLEKAKDELRRQFGRA